MNDTTEQSATTEKITQAAQTPGSILRRLREKAGLDRATVGNALHLTAHYVKALENDDYDKLPCLTFIKGYLRSYALYLHTDVGPVLASFEHYVSTLETEDPRLEQVYRSHRPQDQVLRWAIVGSIVVVIGLTASWWFGFRQADGAGNTGVSPAVATGAAAVETAGIVPAAVDQTVAATRPTARETALLAQASAIRRATNAVADPAGEVQAPVTASAASSQPMEQMVTPSGTPVTIETETAAVTVATDGASARRVSLTGDGDDLLQLSFNGSSWVEIDDGERTRLYNNVLREGDALTVQGEAPFHILLGDAANVKVKLNETLIDFAGDIRPDSSARLVLDNNMLASGDIR